MGRESVAAVYEDVNRSWSLNNAILAWFAFIVKFVPPVGLSYKYRFRLSSSFKKLNKIVNMFFGNALLVYDDAIYRDEQGIPLIRDKSQSSVLCMSGWMPHFKQAPSTFRGVP